MLISYTLHNLINTSQPLTSTERRILEFQQNVLEVCVNCVIRSKCGRFNQPGTVIYIVTLIYLLTHRGLIGIVAEII